MKKLRNLIAGIMSVCMLCPISANAEENNVLYGDANVDGIVDVCDVALLKQHLIGVKKLSEHGIKNCDFWTDDSDISVQHLQQLQRFIIKQINNTEFNTRNYDFYETVISSYLSEDEYGYGHTEIFDNYIDFENYILSFTNDNVNYTASKFLDKYNEDYFKEYDLILTTVKFTEYNHFKCTGITQTNNILNININITPYEDVPDVIPFNPAAVGYFNFMSMPENALNGMSAIPNVNVSDY